MNASLFMALFVAPLGVLAVGLGLAAWSRHADR